MDSRAGLVGKHAGSARYFRDLHAALAACDGSQAPDAPEVSLDDDSG